MLVPRHNALSSGDLIICERAMLKFLDGKLRAKAGMNFKVWDWTIPELYGIVLGMIVKIDLAGILNIRKSEMLDFIIDVEKGYHSTPYHSFYHAVDVVAVLYYMLTDLGAAKYITPLDAICLLIAGLCHDIGHPGLNNVYQVNARTDLAIRYNDKSVLENYSCTLTMELITKHKLFRHVHTCNNEYLGCDPKVVDTALRNLITKTILSTDMTFHFDILESLHNMIEATASCSSDESGEEMDNSCTSSSASSISSSPISSSPISSSPISSSPISQSPISASPTSTSPESSPISLIVQKSFPVKTSDGSHHLQIRLPRPSAIMVTLDSEQREILLKVLIHAADLSNTVRPWNISKRWSDLVVDEFFHQGDLEKENNLPVSPNMDREQAHQCQISLGFGDYVVKPYFAAFASFLHQASIFLNILAENRVLWDNMKNAPPQPTPTSRSSTCPPALPLDATPKGQQRRVSLAAGLLIIPDDIQDKLRSMSSPRSPRLQRKLKRSMSGRSYSHHSLLSARHATSALDDDDDGDYGDDGYRKPTRRKSENPNAAENSTLTVTGGARSSSHHYGKRASSQQQQQRRLGGGRVRRSSSLDHNMIRQITALYGTGDAPSQSEQGPL